MANLTHKNLKKELLKNSQTLAAYNELQEEFQLINEMLHARKRVGFTQEKVAKKMKTTTAVVSRLESLQAKDQHSPSFDTLKRYAHAVNCIIQVKLVPKHDLSLNMDNNISH